MNLFLISKGVYTVYAVAKSREHCELLEFLEAWPDPSKRF